MWVALLLSCSLALLFVSNCTPERGSEGTSSSASSGTSDGGSTTGSTLSCDLFEKCSGNDCQCSGSDCCKEDDDCQDMCKDTLSRDGLNLSGSARDTCFHLEEDTVKKLFELIEDLDQARVDRLREIGQDEDDMELLCSAVKELDYDLLGDRIDGYTGSDAKKALGWLAESEYAVAIFENAEDDKGVPMFRNLLQQRGSGSDDAAILDGLKEFVDVEDDDGDSSTVMHWALDSSNHELVRWIHEKIIAADDDALCGDDNASNRPDPPSGVNQQDHKEDYGEPACILGVYCHISSGNNSDDNKFRKEMADLIDSDVDVSHFIKADTAEGGLGLSEDIAEDWKLEACCKLKESDSWTDGSGLVLLNYSCN